jgi:hypothetical protein
LLKTFIQIFNLSKASLWFTLSEAETHHLCLKPLLT